MSDNEAYTLICKKYKSRPVVIDCRDYGVVYGFFLAPPGSNPNKKNFVGRMMTCVDKKTKEVYLEEDWYPIPDRALNFLKRLSIK